MITCHNKYCEKKGNFTCTRCKIISYCSVNCQKHDWQNHKKLCNKPSDIIIDGYQLTILEENSLKNNPLDIEKKLISPLQLKIRQVIGKNMFLAIIKSFPIETQETYIKYPPWKFYCDDKKRPLRSFGVNNYTHDKRLHTITLNKKGKTYFTIGGTELHKIKEVDRWDDDQIKLILNNKKSGMFLDPLGYQFCIDIAKNTGYDIVSDHACICCNDTYVKASCDMPVLGNHDLQVSCMKKCENCNLSKKLRLCNGCRKTYYCSVECQAKSWPQHKKQCKKNNNH